MITARLPPPDEEIITIPTISIIHPTHAIGGTNIPTTMKITEITNTTIPVAVPPLLPVGLT
jgi:hypothetical protein